ncbi:MAG: TorF family putative porin [Gammaproteobacteria bacterium]|jgi:uncharacterized protein (TIGR02001 family)
MMKKTLISMACAAAMAAPAAHAELSANIGVTSDYLWRGVTQSGHEAAVSGGVDYAHDSGFYAGIWTSTLGGDNQELDGYLGFAGEYNDLGYDVGYIYYGYLNADDWDFSEIYGSLSWMWLSGGINYTVSGQADDNSRFIEGDIYYFASATFDLETVSPELSGWGVGFTVGYYDFEANSDFDYTQLQMDITKSAGDFGDFTLTVANEDYTDDTSLAVSWSKTF